jgi:hypothetical protein
VGSIGDSLQQFAVNVKAQFVSPADSLDIVGLPTRLDGGRGSHSIAIAGESFKITSAHTPEDSIVAIGTDGKIVKVVHIQVATEGAKMTILGARSQVDVHLDDHIIELHTRIRPSKPVWLVQFDKVLALVIPALELLTLIRAPSTTRAAEIVLKKRRLLIASGATADQQQQDEHNQATPTPTITSLHIISHLHRSILTCRTDKIITRAEIL